MPSSSRLSLFLTLAALHGAPHAALAGPLSELYLSAGDNEQIHVLQGASVVRSWAMENYEERAITVTDSVRTYNSYPSFNVGNLHTYTTNGIYITTDVTADIPNVFDAGTDGVFVYTVQFNTGNVIRTNLNWSDPTVLFNAGGAGQDLAITYDPLNNSLWIADWQSSTIENRALNGTLLGSFVAPVNQIVSLALDYVDGTLWFGTQTDLGFDRTFYQFSRSGALLDTELYTTLDFQNYVGGDFQFVQVTPPDTSTPEPGMLALLGLGSLGVLYRRSRRSARYVK